MALSINEDISNLSEKKDYDDDFSDTEQAERNNKARKRIDELMEKKRLKYLLDDSEDWDI